MAGSALGAAEPAATPAALLECRVVDRQGRGIAGAEVFASPAVEHHRLETVDAARWQGFDRGEATVGTTDGEGRILVGGRGPGDYDLGARAPGFAPGVLWGVHLGAAAAGKKVEIVLGPEATVVGKVVDGEGSPVEGAKIGWKGVEPEAFSVTSDDWEEPWVTLSDARGEFAFGQIAAGRFIAVTARKAGFITAAALDVEAGREPLLLRLSSGGRIEGQALADGEPARYAHVALREAEAGETLEKEADREGRFAFAAVAPGLYELKVESLSGRVHVEGPFRLDDDATRRFEIALSRKAAAPEAGAGVAPAAAAEKPAAPPKLVALRARVVDPGGAPVAGAMVRLVRPNTSFQQEVPSAADGTLTWPSLLAAEYYVAIEKAGYFFESRYLEVDGAPEPLEWRLEPALARVAGSLLGLDAAERSRLEVAAFGYAQTVEATLDGDSFRFDALAPGTWDLMAHVPGRGIWLLQRLDVAAADRDVRADLDFGRLVPWVGRFRQGGRPTPVEISVHDPMSGLIFGSGIAAGARLELRLVPGRYELFLKPPKGASRVVPFEAGAALEQVIELDAVP